MRTAMTDMVGCEYPIFAFSHCRDVVAAVTNAGGFGVLGGAGQTPDQIDIDLTWLDDHAHGKYGIDLLLPQKFGPPGSAGALPPLPAEHLAFVEELLERYGVPPLLPEESAGFEARRQHTARMMEEAADIWDIAGAHNVSVYVSALGAPPPHLIEQAHERGGVVGALVGAVPHAARQRNAGVDFVIAQGTEAGGHCGEIATMVLVPDIVDVMGDIPVLAAGGIATGRQMAAAMALGADRRGEGSEG
jgi:NAD(P)H-dependent flavin oxidoreductase YrpB (nitropropane dioxygenase family)